jgi:hypothetical protein
MSIETRMSDGIEPFEPPADNSNDIVERSVVPTSLDDFDLAPDTRQALRQFMQEEFSHFLADVEWRVKQAYDVENRESIGGGSGQIYTEDLNVNKHMLTGYTTTANSPVAGSIAWSAVHVVFAGVDYTAADGSTNLKYVWFVKPGSGTTVTLNTSNTKPTLGANDALLFVNNNGVPINALDATIPVVLADGAVDSGAIVNGAVTAAKTDFYSTLNTAITNAQNAADLAQATADGAIVTYFQANPPWATGDATAGGATNPASKVGDIWYDSDDGQAYRWSGAGGTPANTWVMIEDNSIAAALAAAQAAQGTANSKITTFYSVLASVPSATAIGDLWVVTDQGNQLRRATATGTGSWTTVQISGAAIANGGVGDTQLGSGISGAKLTSGSVGSTQLGTGSVSPTKLNILQHVLY